MNSLQAVGAWGGTASLDGLHEREDTSRPTFKLDLHCRASNRGQSSFERFAQGELMRHRGKNTKDLLVRGGEQRREEKIKSDPEHSAVWVYEPLYRSSTTTIYCIQQPC